METIQERHDSATDKVAGLFGGADKPEPEKEVPNGETAEVEPQAAEATEQEPTRAQPEEVEVEIEGETYLVPKKISDRFIQHADYTRKTQDIAEMRRALTAREQAIIQEQAFSQETASERRQLAILEAQLEQYKRVDWASLETGELMKARAQLDQLKDVKAELENTIKQKRGTFEQKIGQLMQQNIESGQKYVETHIKDFNDAAKKSLMVYGLNEGYTREELDRVIDPRVIVTLWKASQWDKLQASKPGVNNKAQQASPTIRPGASTPRATRVQQLNKEFKAAKSTKGKKDALEALLSAKM